jgi:cell division septation protein DedD
MVVHQQDGEKRYYFRRRQLVILAVGFTITASIIYFLGVLTGRQAGEISFLKNDRPRIKIPVKSLIQESSSEPGVQSKQELASRVKLAEPVGAQPSGQDPRKETKQFEKSAQAEVKPIVPQVRQSDSSPLKSTRKKAGGKTSDLSTAQKEIPASEGPAVNETSKMWTVQVGAFPDEASATLGVYNLRSKGYSAYMVEAMIKERTWYRVRVGLVVTRNEAEELRKVLRSKEGLTDSFLTRQ